jgi:UDP-perosamine 4-acetyltransferase
VVDLLLHEQDGFEVVGLVDPNRTDDLLGIKVLGGDDLLPDLIQKGITHAFPGVGIASNVDNRLRARIYSMLKRLGFTVPNLISSKANIRSAVEMGDGNLVQMGAVLDVGTKLGNNCVINFGVLIGHYSVLEDHTCCTGNVILNGRVKIGEGTLLGMGCVVMDDVGSWCKVSPGTVVVKPVPDGSIVFGNPMRVMPDFRLKKAS